LNTVFLAIAIWCDFDRGCTAVASTAAKVALAAIVASVASLIGSIVGGQLVQTPSTGRALLR